MRLYGMYYICKEYKEKVQGMNPKTKNAGGHTVYFIDNWKDGSRILDSLANILPLRERARKVYEAIPVMYRDKNKFDISDSIRKNYVNALNQLSISMQTIIDAYEVLNTKEIQGAAEGFDVKLPEFENLKEFSKCLDDLNFAFTQCPYLQNRDGQIRYGSVDVGSTWLSFFIVGTGATLILKNLSQIIGTAIKIKSHVTTVRQQEEILRSMKMKNDLSEEMIDSFKEVNRTIRKGSLEELESKLGKLADGEEEGKAEKSIEKLAFWMDKGLEIYSSIDAPKEIKDLFPKQEETSFLVDDIQKLIEAKQDGQ